MKDVRYGIDHVCMRDMQKNLPFHYRSISSSDKRSEPRPLSLSYLRRDQLLVDETPQVVKNCLAAMRADLAEFPAWSGAPEPTDEFLLMFLRSEVFSPSKAAKRYRKFWKV